MVASVLASLAIAGAAIAAPRAHAAGPTRSSPFMTGIVDPAYQGRNDDGVRQDYDQAMSAAPALIRINVYWSAVAHRRPPAGTRLDDPRNPGYDWTYVDDAVREATDRRLYVVLTIVAAPRWAEGARRPRAAPPFSWKPSPAAFGAFAQAAARRYWDGSPDPRRPDTRYARVVYWEAWNEPNLAAYLSPSMDAEQGAHRAREPVALPAHAQRLLQGCEERARQQRRDHGRHGALR